MRHIQTSVIAEPSFTQHPDRRDNPQVWIPSQRDFIQVDEITSTGKVDLRKLKQIALQQPAGANLSSTS